ncbi:MAG: DUF421 domain-containing protein [Clostridiales bacterium]|uniref:DUF421 domain-containing protein n=1 Tax=Terrisporobacter sp. TaxID=1965305 RepID=UPI002A43E9F6|nr:DUF421 domain-containing protein [Terrisporobacter sp.]MCI7206805.1 DUF421 domain-containing protein [Clostridium sp.]MDD5879996.1 DUF421 domain-containing protein [Clostridiales bacterium]MDD7755043.1 DUF421 domain-containing protein [Clostridiales bacterium]MDY4135930.1 DUF421 domain-containing protein [Terrisporobacter sp.]MDY4736548.1 DUF421 domain-containing protein [Terrisporobacter sp.]
MLVVFIRSIILYVAVLISLRVMGKGEIAEMNCFDLVITLLIAEVASTPMENNDIPLLYGIASLIGLVFIQTVISVISLKFRSISRFVSGKPSILINKGKIDYKILKKEKITIDELLEQLRIQGYFNIKYVQYALLETDGNLSVVPTTNYNSTPSVEYKHMPISLIQDGKIIKESLKSIQEDETWLNNILKSHHIDNVKDVLLCVLDEYDKIFIQKKYE